MSSHLNNLNFHKSVTSYDSWTAIKTRSKVIDELKFVSCSCYYFYHTFHKVKNTDFVMKALHEAVRVYEL